MKLENTRQAYYDSTSRASELSRQLSFAALAIVWIFKTDQPGGSIGVPHALLWPSALAVFSLGFDILQYIYGSVAWGIYNRHKEKRIGLNDEQEFSAPPYINWPTNIFFYLKISAVLVCYVGLLRYLFQAIWH